MKYKVFLLVILGVFVLWGTPHTANAERKEAQDFCREFGYVVVVDEDEWWCCYKQSDGGVDCDLGDDDNTGPSAYPGVIEQPPAKRDPNVLTPRPLTEQPKKGTTRQPAQKVR